MMILIQASIGAVFAHIARAQPAVSPAQLPRLLRRTPQISAVFRGICTAQLIPWRHHLAYANPWRHHLAYIFSSMLQIY